MDATKAQVNMLLVQGFLKKAGDDSYANFSGYYLTLAYSDTPDSTDNFENLDTTRDEENAEIGVRQKFTQETEGNKFLLASKDAPNILKNSPLNLNIIKNIKDISGYKGELGKEKVQAESPQTIFNTTSGLNALSVLTRIEVSNCGDFTLQISELSEGTASDLLINVYAPDGSQIQDFRFSTQYLKSLVDKKSSLELFIKPVEESCARRSSLEAVSRDYFCEGNVITLNGTEVPAGVDIICWGATQNLKQFNVRDFQPVAYTKTLDKGSFKLKVPFKTRYKTLYLSIFVGKLLCKRVELDANGNSSKICFILKSPSFHVKKDDRDTPCEECFFYKALRTTPLGLDEQLNTSNFIQPISCFNINLSDMQKIAYGQLLVVKLDWYLHSDRDLAQKLSPAVINSLIKDCFDESFADYFLGGEGLTTGLDIRPSGAFEKALGSVVRYTFLQLEETLKKSSSRQRAVAASGNSIVLKVKQHISDVRECLFIPIAYEKFDTSTVLAYKNILEEFLLEEEYRPLLMHFKFYADESYDFDVDNLIKHLNENLEYYHRAIWYKMPANKRFSLLDNCIAPNTNGKSIASIVENRVVGILGNSIIMPLVAGYSFDPSLRQYSGNLMELYKNVDKDSEFFIQIPSL